MIRASALAVTLPAAALAQEAPTWAEVGALFAERCVKCHSGADAPMGLELDSYGAALAGGWSGRVLVAGDAMGSPLVQRVHGRITPRMPLDGPPFLSEAEIALVEAWVLAGLPEGVPGAVAEAPERVRPAPGEPVTYADIEPILLKACIKCHSANSKLAAPPEGLRLDSLEHVLAGGERLAVLPGNPEMSELWRRVEGLASPRMPFDGPPWLAEEDIRLIRDWIAQGAPDAEGNRAPLPTGAEVRLRGFLTTPDAIDGARFLLDGGTRIDDTPGIGEAAEMRGTVLPDGSVRADRLRAH